MTGVFLLDRADTGCEADPDGMKGRGGTDRRYVCGAVTAHPDSRPTTEYLIPYRIPSPSRDSYFEVLFIALAEHALFDAEGTATVKTHSNGE